MPYFYSRSKRSFFHPDTNPEIPPDAVAVTDDQHRELMEGQAAGLQIEPDEAGKPRLVPFEPTAEELKTALLSAARAALNASDVVVLRAFEAGTAVPEAWVAYRAQLRDVLRGALDTLPAAPAV